MRDPSSPGDRLRLAREVADISRKHLAEKLGRALSTVRAHENGQNAISAEVAAEYAEQLNVSPAYILYGYDAAVRDRGEVTVEQVQSTTTVVPLVGRLAPQTFQSELPERLPFKSLSISLPVSYGDGLVCYLDADIFETSGAMDVIVTRPFKGGRLRLSDEVVIELRVLDSAVERSLWKVGAAAGRAAFYQGDNQATADRVMGLEKKYAESLRQDRDWKILGVVAMKLRMMRPDDSVDV